MDILNALFLDGTSSKIQDLEYQLRNETDPEKIRELAKLIKELHSVKAEQAKHGIDPNKLLEVGANIAGILAVINFETVGIIGTKAFQMIKKL